MDDQPHLCRNGDGQYLLYSCAPGWNKVCHMWIAQRIRQVNRANVLVGLCPHLAMDPGEGFPVFVGDLLGYPEGCQRHIIYLDRSHPLHVKKTYHIGQRVKIGPSKYLIASNGFGYMVAANLETGESKHGAHFVRYIRTITPEEMQAICGPDWKIVEGEDE